MTLFKMITTSLTFYFIPSGLSFAADVISMSFLIVRTGQIQRVLTSIQLIGVALVANLLRPDSLTFQKYEWLAIVLLAASVPVVLSKSDEGHGGTMQNVRIAYGMMVASVYTLLYPVLEYTYCSERMQNRSLYAQNVILFGLKSAFLSVTLPIGDLPHRGSKLFEWESRDAVLCVLLTADGLLLPHVLTRGGVLMFLLLLAVATAFFAVVAYGIDLMWACGVVVSGVGCFMIIREYRVRRLVDVSRVAVEQEDLP